MTEKVEYSSLYKFLVSLGLIIMISPAICMGFLLQENEILLINKEELLNITENARLSIEWKQEKLLWFLNNAPCILGVVFIIGAILMIVGLFCWIPSQKVTDKKNKVENKELENQLRKLDEEENTDKIQKEIIEIEKEELKETSESSESYTIVQIQNMQKEVQEKNRIINKFLVQRYKKVEEAAAYKISEEFRDGYNADTNIRIGRMEYDVILKSKDDERDYIFEIKYWFKAHSWDSATWSDTIYRLHRQVENYEQYMGRTAIPVLMIVTLDDQVTSAAEIAKFRIKDKDIRVRIIKESELGLEDVSI